jgi:hypothetical protein
MFRAFFNLRSTVLIAALGAGMTGSAFAQPYSGNPYAFERWQAAWDNDRYDRRHIILATVTGFEPYRLQVRRHDGVIQTVDLKNGTVIRPTGATPQPGQRVALVGYYSHGTFIANRLVLHD